MSSILTSPYNLVRAGPERRAYVLKCRFSLWAAPCHARISPYLQMCPHLEQAASEMGVRFLEDMDHQGWEPVDGRLRVTAGPIPAVEVGNASLPSRVAPRPAERGPHPRFGPAYDSPVGLAHRLDETDVWQFELSGRFVRPMLPTVTTVETAERIERVRGGRRGRRI